MGLALLHGPASGASEPADAWQPFKPVQRPAVPPPADVAAFTDFQPRNPIDHFLAAEWATRGLTPRPEASRPVLMRRLYVDLVGLNPSPEEQRAFLEDTAPGAYERLVDRLLNDPRHGERWARHWMDVWRYSDWAGWTGGNQIRDSKPHIWRWRDWIVESLNADKPYDRMLLEMLAADELAPEDTGALRATGFLVRNYKMLSRERWMEDTVKHTAQAFLGLTMGCAQCHDHARDPISQREYFQMRAIFEPHQVRTDRLPGELDRARDGLVRVYDSSNTVTWLFERGDERHPLTNEVIQPGVPALLGGRYRVEPVELPRAASHPDERPFVMRDHIDAAQRAVAEAQSELEQARAKEETTPDQLRELELVLDAARKRHDELDGAWAAFQDRADAAKSLRAVHQQRAAALAQARLQEHRAVMAVAKAEAEVAAKKDKAEAELKKAIEAREKAGSELSNAVVRLEAPLNTEFTLPPGETYPANSTGRRLAFARWLVDPGNPLTARVAANHIWLRHVGRGIVATPANFGSEGARPTHPRLLDWLAAELMEPSVPGQATESAGPPEGWSMRHLHRLICTSAAYRMASTPDERNLGLDPDNQFLWRMNSRRMEAECVRDNLLGAGGLLDLTQGGPDIDHALALTSHRRSLYLRNAAEKQSEFLQIFDGPSVNECYQRHTSVMPQQALAMSNSQLALRAARSLAERLAGECGADRARFVEEAFQRLLARDPSPEERSHCLEFLGTQPAGTEGRTPVRALENLILVLLNHNDFTTVR